MIKIEHLCKKYNVGKSNELLALKDVSLEVADGEMVAVCGTSGAGKSTLLYCLAGMETMEGGSIDVDGQRIDCMSEKELSSFRGECIGFVVQDFALIEEYSVYENVQLAFSFLKKDRDADKKVTEVIETVGLTDKKNVLVKNLSGGQKQRVSIARAIVKNPKVILADEPTGALDTKTTKEIMDLLKDINERGTTIIIITHDEHVAARCDRIIELNDGQVSC